MPEQWFHKWFNSPYYHLLYKQRDHREAEHFIDNLCCHLKPSPQARMLDIACGRGRHAIYLNKKGYEVTGIDLSIENIRYARQYESPGLHFYVHDMRSICYNNYFDMALNLFTSFGYFDDDEDNITSLKTFNKALKKDGLFVLDYFNSTKVLQYIVPRSVKTVEGIDFHIQKKIENNKIIKTIKFEHENKAYDFMEKVSLFSVSDFEYFFKRGGFKIVDYFGSYNLEKFDLSHSDRLIFICKKHHA